MAERILGNRYLLKERIGIGGMASVYAAEDTTLNRLVAVKIMLPQYASDPNFAQRFRQEATAAAALQSPRIVSIHDWGCDDEDCFIVMELLTGSDMRALIRNEAPLDPHRIRDIGGQVCQALSVAHERKTVHRDITPQNIMVLPDGNVKVMDFGIAKVAGSSMTQTSTVLGTAHYLSPEQAQGRTLTFASDLYSLGAVLYEAATGQPVFNGPDPISVALQHVSASPVPLRAINPSIDIALEAIIMKALAKDPSKRFQSAEAMRKALAGNTDASVQTSVLAIDQVTRPESTQVLPQQTATLPNTTLVMPSSSSDKVLKVGTDAISKHPKKKRRWPAVAAILTMSVLLSAAAILAIEPWEPSLPDTGGVTAQTQDENASRQPDYQGGQSASDETLSENASSSEAETDAANQSPQNPPSIEDYQALLVIEEAYNEVEQWDEAIKQAAQDFNTNYFNDYGQRQGYAQRAASIYQEIWKQSGKLSSLGLEISLDFPWYNFYLDVRELYECLEFRMSPITEAWDISLSYSSPGEHQSEILEPIKRNEDETGNNRYLTQFKEIYPVIEPPSLASDNASSSHAENAFFSFDIPDFWVDRVDIVYRGSTIIVRPKEDTSGQGALCTLRIVTSPGEETGGDIAAPQYYSDKNSHDRMVHLSFTNYPWFAFWQMHGSDSKVPELSEDLLDVYVNLQTNGEYDLDSLANIPTESDLSQVGTFNLYENVIMPTVQLRDL